MFWSNACLHPPCMWNHTISHIPTLSRTVLHSSQFAQMTRINNCTNTCVLETSCPPYTKNRPCFNWLMLWRIRICRNDLQWTRTFIWMDFRRRRKTEALITMSNLTHIIYSDPKTWYHISLNNVYDAWWVHNSLNLRITTAGIQQ